MLAGGAPWAVGLLLFQWYYFGTAISVSYGDNISWSPTHVVSAQAGGDMLQLGSPAGPFSASCSPARVAVLASCALWWAFAPPLSWGY